MLTLNECPTSMKLEYLQTKILKNIHQTVDKSYYFKLDKYSLHP